MASLYMVNNVQGPQAGGGILPLTPVSNPQAAPANLRSWQVGQILDAEVLVPAQSGATLLRIAGAVVSTQTTLTLVPGQTLHVKVVNTNTPPVLQVVTPQPSTAADTLSQSLRAALPRQIPLAPLLANLGWLAQIKSSTLSGLPPAVVETARQVFSSLSTPKQLSTAAGLSASVQRSGVFLENHLSQADTTTLETDFKAGLLRLREVLLTTEATASAPGRLAQANSALPPAAAPAQTLSQTGSALDARAPAQAPVTQPAMSAPPPLRGAPLHAQPAVMPTFAEPGLRAESAAGLLSQVEGGLARVQLSQLASLPNNSSPPAWTLELPVRHAGESHVIQMRLEADDPRSPAEQAERAHTAWSVTLALDLKGLGPLNIKVSLRDEKVSASFWADRTETAKLLTQHLDQLHAKMNEAGLDVASISCAAGCRPTPPDSRMSPALLDLKI